MYSISLKTPSHTRPAIQAYPAVAELAELAELAMTPDP